MSKGNNQRSNREVRKPKQDKPKKGAASASASVPAAFAKSGQGGPKPKKG